MLLIGVVVGVALAVPPALLGPDGPTWLGPLPPQQSTLAGVDRDVVVVDPITGALRVESWDAPGQQRIWDGRRWTVRGGGITDDWPIREGFSLQLGPDGALESSSSHWGRRCDYRYDASGRLVGMSWEGGARVDIAYDAQDRVVETRGPGRALHRYRWGRDLEVDRAPGGRLTVRADPPNPEGQRTVQVIDGAGRAALSTWAQQDGVERLLSWSDPRGNQSRLDHGKEGLSLVSSGRSWELRLDPDRRLKVLTAPNGGAWTWTWDEAGRMVGLQDPGGRMLRLLRNADGQVISVDQGGRRTDLERDPAGRLQSVVSPNGASTRVARDAQGRVVGITDAAGNLLALERDRSGRLRAVITRTGARWELSSDAMGRVVEVVDPSGRSLGLERDGAGRVIRLKDSVFGSTQLARGGDGEISRVRAPDGRETGLARDGHGRVVRILRPDGSTVTMERDAAGELRWVALGEEGVEIERSAEGLPLRAASVRWSRDAVGRVQAVDAPGLHIELERDLAGRLWGASAGSWVVGIQHDASGLPVAWRGSDGDLVLQRDALGDVIVEARGPDELRVLRDPRGWINRVSLGESGWRFGRDAAGQLQLVQGPDGLRAGIDRDALGRVTLLRHPGGTLTRVGWGPDLLHVEVDAPSGQPLLRRSVGLDADGRTLWVQEDGGERAAWSYDPLNQLIAIEEGLDSAWSWAPDAIEGPGEELLVRDGAGQVTEARVSGLLPTWGVADAVLSVFRDKDGAIEGFTGDRGVARLRHDPLGRLVEVVSAGQRWRLSFDPLGRLDAVEDPTGGRRALRWMPGSIGNSGDLLRVGQDQLWLPGADRSLGLSTPGGDEALVHIGGDPRFVVDAAGRAVALHATPLGRLDSGAAHLAGAGGGLQIFAAGPVVFGDLALDPVSGAPTSGVRRWPWESAGPRGPLGRSELDPAAWDPQGPWHRPIDLLVALGEVAPIDGAAWTPIPGAELALPWLPASFEGGGVPIGPGPWMLPLDEDPLVAALLAQVLPGAEPPGPRFVEATVLAMEADLDLAPELPPGVEIPGLPTLIPRSRWPLPLLP